MSASTTGCWRGIMRLTTPGSSPPATRSGRAWPASGGRRRGRAPSWSGSRAVRRGFRVPMGRSPPPRPLDRRSSRCLSRRACARPSPRQRMRRRSLGRSTTSSPATSFKRTSHRDSRRRGARTPSSSTGGCARSTRRPSQRTWGAGRRRSLALLPNGFCALGATRWRRARSKEPDRAATCPSTTCYSICGSAPARKTAPRT